MNHVVVRKVKMLKKPKFDITKLNEMYSEANRLEAKEDKKGGEGGGDDEEAQNLLKKWVIKLKNKFIFVCASYFEIIFINV